MSDGERNDASVLDMDAIRAEAMEFANVGTYRYRLDGSIVYIDRGSLELLDLLDEYPDPSVLVGRDIGSLFIHVHEPGTLRRAVQEKGHLQHFEYQFRTLSGVHRWVWHDSYTVRDPDTGEEQIQVIALDITELKKMTMALDASQKLYRTLAEESAQGIGVVALDEKLLYANEALAGIVDTPLQVVRSSSATDLWQKVHPEDIPMLQDEFQMLQTGSSEPRRVEYRLLRPDGSTRWVSTLAHPVQFEGMAAVQMMVTDVTEAREAEKKRREQEQKILHAQKLESLGVMAGGIAHDFNNLLFAILGHSDMAAAHLDDPERVSDHLRHLGEAAEQASRLCQQLLAYAGRGKVSRQVLDVNRLIRGTVELIDLSSSKMADVRFDLAGKLPAIEADPAQVRQALLNLVTNASESLGDGPGRIQVCTGIRRLTEDDMRTTLGDATLEPGDYVFLSVRDDGHGMDDETLAQIFDPFYTTKFTGRGLGLASVLGIMKGHAGGIQVESSPARGSVFTMLFPPTRQRASTPAHDDESIPWQGEGTVLVADDEPHVLRSLSTMLETLGFDVVSARDGEEAVESFTKHADAVRLVLMDVTMPRMNGIQAAREIRASAPDVPLLITSGYNQEDTAEELEALQDATFLRKPYGLERLRRVLQKILD